MDLPSSRYFDLADLLHAYQGAVRSRMVVEQQGQPQAVAVTPQQPARPVIEHTAEVAAMTQNNQGFPSIKFTRGGR